MLVLARRTGEAVVLPDKEVTIEVVAVKGRRVKIGVKAPQHVAIRRSPTSAGRTSSLSSEKSMNGTCKIVIAVADKRLQDAYRSALERHGIESHVAGDGLTCLELLERVCPDALVLEPFLPWGWADGVLAVMAEGRDILPVPVLIVGESEYRLPAGIRLTIPLVSLVKPVSETRLVNSVLSLIGSRSIVTPNHTLSKDENAMPAR